MAALRASGWSSSERECNVGWQLVRTRACTSSSAIVISWGWLGNRTTKVVRRTNLCERKEYVELGLMEGKICRDGACVEPPCTPLLSLPHSPCSACAAFEG